MAEVTYKGKTFEVDEDGFLLKFDEWCPEWLEYVKESEGITDLNEDHQKILDFLQDYYRKNGIAPMVRILSKNTGYKLKEVYELFPSGPGKGACKMAGLPKPTGCVRIVPIQGERFPLALFFCCHLSLKRPGFGKKIQVRLFTFVRPTGRVSFK